MSERVQTILTVVGNTPTEIYQIKGESQVERSKHLAQKLVPREELESLGDFLRRRNKQISFTSGAYDVIHKGHARYLNLAKSLGDVLVVGLNSDSSIRGYKGPDRPILHQEDRAEMLSFLGSVDYITIYDEPTGDEVIRRLKPDSYLCVEGSWEKSFETKAEIIAMVGIGGKVFITPRQDPLQSTSDIISTIAEKYGKKAYEDYKKMMEAANGNK